VSDCLVMGEISSPAVSVVPRAALAGLGGMLHRRDAVGVLTVYVDGREAATPSHVAVREVRVGLDRLVKALAKSHGKTIARHAAVVRREVDQALDEPTGESFALFGGLEDGARHRQPLLSAGTSRISLGPRPDVRQMCRALQMAQPLGVALLDGKGARVLEWRGELDELWADALPELEEPNLVGPAHGHVRDLPGAAPGLTVSRQGDLFERRMAGEYERFLVAAGRRVSDLAAERGWTELVVAGDGEWPGALISSAASPALDVMVLPHLELWRSDGQLAREIGRVAAGRRELHQANLVERSRDEARLGGVGLAPVLEALGEARVKTLLLPEEGVIRGLSSADFSVLTETGAVPPGIDPDAVVADEMLADAMIARAFDTGADVVVLSGAGARALDGLGAAAVLRW
jgi:hypothetical protein